MVMLIITVYLNCIVYFVHPHLEYAAPIWDPHLIKDTNLKCSKICYQNVLEAMGPRVPGSP